MGNVYNHDIAGIYRRINRFIDEIIKSVSAGGSQVNDFDQVRLGSYLDSITTYQAWVVGEPHLDLPESHPREYVLEAPAVVVNVESESIRDVVTLMELARDELVNSQSARNASNLIPFDNARLTATIGKAKSFLTQYIQTTTPLDLPESSPQEELSGPGQTGV